jgi:RNA polymerase sigma factor (sigma-70 family)
MPDEREPPQEDLAKRKELEARFEALYEKYFDYTVIYIARMRFSREDARDLAQRTFIRVFRSMATFRGKNEAEEKAFIKKTALRVVLNERRDHSTEKRFSDEISMEDLPSPENTPTRNLFTNLSPSSGEDYTRRRETIQRLYDALRKLPDNLQKPLRLRIPGNTYNEIAAALNLTVDTVKSNLRDARRRLDEMLGEDPTGIDWPEDLPGGKP